MKHALSGLASRRTFLSAFAGCSVAGLAGRVLRGQDATFSTDVKVINILASVREKGSSGRIVDDLAKDDFDIAEDGRPQVIKYFSRETELPLTLGLLVDTSTSQRLVLGDEKSASYRFLERVLREDRDQAFLFHFDFDTELLQDVTSSRKKLQQALDQVGLAQNQPQMRRGGGGGYPGGGGGGGYPGGGGRRGGGTTLYDAILLASNEIMRNQQGRKALVVLTDGVDNGSKVPLSQAIEAAQRADALVYSIYFTGEEPGRSPLGGLGGVTMGRRGGMRQPVQMQRPDGKKILQQMSRETGGGFFEVTKKVSIDDIYDRIEEELRNQYSIGYTSDARDSGYAFRKITLTAKRKNLIVQTREGYYPRS
jgi:VWFA-related protein